jgi:hypothetical protein
MTDILPESSSCQIWWLFWSTLPTLVPAELSLHCVHYQEMEHISVGPSNCKVNKVTVIMQKYILLQV